MSSETKLNPCPFCGSEDLCALERADGCEAFVCCEGCCTNGPVASLGCRDPEEETVDLDAEAVELWNKRAEPGDTMSLFDQENV